MKMKTWVCGGLNRLAEWTSAELPEIFSFFWVQNEVGKIKENMVVISLTSAKPPLGPSLFLPFFIHIDECVTANNLDSIIPFEGS